MSRNVSVLTTHRVTSGLPVPVICHEEGVEDAGTPIAVSVQMIVGGEGARSSSRAVDRKIKPLWRCLCHQFSWIAEISENRNCLFMFRLDADLRIAGSH